MVPVSGQKGKSHTVSLEKEFWLQRQKDQGINLGSLTSQLGDLGQMTDLSDSHLKNEGDISNWQGCCLNQVG